MKTILFSSSGVDHYQMGLLEGLLQAGLTVEMVGNDRLNTYQELFNLYPGAIPVNLRGGFSPNVSPWAKIMRMVQSYGRILAYPFGSDAVLVHLQWLIRFQKFDRVILPLLFHLSGKKVVVTAHEIDPEARHHRSGFFNRLSLKLYYHQADQIIVHTDVMKQQLIEWFHPAEEKIHILPMGLNHRLRQASLTQARAREILGIGPDKKVMLFFGMITWFKGVDILLETFHKLSDTMEDLVCVIAGRSATGAENHVAKLTATIGRFGLEDRVLFHLKYIPDEEIATYFMAADCLVLPYRNLYQSAVLFMGLTFGLPVIATDVGALRLAIREGENGWLCPTENPLVMAQKIKTFFASDLYHHPIPHRARIRREAEAIYSWKTIGAHTANLYQEALR